MKLLSYIDILIKKSFKIKAINSILKSSIRYTKIQTTDSGDILIQIYSWRIKSFERIFKAENIEFEIKKKYGLLSKIGKNKHRMGLVFGFLIFLAVVYYSRSVIWRIDIKGNQSIDREKIVASLEKEGIYLGRYIPTIDYDKIHNRFLMNNSDFSWISVNIKGNIATVNIRETEKHKIESEKVMYSNVIAGQDGQIALISVIDGEKKVSIGETVKKGDLLISGIIDSKAEGIRLTAAKGDVYAFVNKKILVKMPLKEEIKKYTGNQYEDKSLVLFKKYINLFKKYSNYDKIYDTIEETEQITIFGKIKLPIQVKTSRYREYEYINVEYTKEQATDHAFAELRNQLDCVLEGSELLSKEIKINYDKDYVYLECLIYCFENIAEEKEFYVG